MFEEMNVQSRYLEDVVSGLWDYAEDRQLVHAGILETENRSTSRPSVVRRGAEISNIMTPANGPPDHGPAVLEMLPKGERHRHFRSMRSSQALALSVFGALKRSGKIGVLADLRSDEGLAAFFPGRDASEMTMEHAITGLGEPRSTSVDVWLSGASRTAVECKFTESDFGQCSRPTLRQGRDRNYDSEYCDGSYSHQRCRKSRCTLTEIGVKYWSHVPELFGWNADRDHIPCPLRSTYQLARNVMAATVDANGKLDPTRGHALVLYDARNPAFQPGGKADNQWQAATSALRDPSLLRRCSWQRLVGHCAIDAELAWLLLELRNKYGISDA